MSSRRINFFDGFTSETTPDTIITTLTDTDAIHDNVSGEINAISNKAAPVLADILIIEDSEDGFSKKNIQITDLPLVSGSDPTAIHDDVAAEISGITDKAAPVAADFIMIEDSEASDAKKSITIGTLQPMTTRGDMTFKNASNVTARLPIGTVSQWLVSDGTDVAWEDAVTATSWLTGGAITINGGDSGKYDVAAGTGVIINPNTLLRTSVSWGAKTAVTPGNIGTEVVTTVSIDVNGAIFESNVDQTNEERRTFICLGSVLHVDMAEITATFDEPAYSVGAGVQLYDLYKSLGFINISGNDYSAAATNLTLNKSAGIIEGPGINTSDLKAPNTKATPADAPLTWFYNFVTAGVFTVVEGVTSIDPEQFNDQTLGLIAVPNNKFQIKRFFYNGSNETTVIQYGQDTYSSIAEAEASLNTEIFNKNPQLSTFPLRGYLIIKKGTTDLTNTTNAKFITGQKIDLGGAGGGASTSTTTLQRAYDNSVDPEITLGSSPGGISIIDASSPVSGNLWELQNNARSVDFFSVSTTDTTVETNLIVRDGHEFRMFDAGSSNHVGFVAPALVSDQIWILPDADGSSSQVLTTDGAGNLSWTSSGAGDVTAASSFGTDNRLIRSDGTGKGVQSSGISINDSDDMSGINILAATTLTGAGSGITALNMGNAGSGTLAVNRGGTGVTTSTGTGSVVRQVSPVLNTPNLGTPNTLVLTNATGTPTSIGLANGTGLPIVAGTTGTLSVARGGTGQTTVAAYQASMSLTTADTQGLIKKFVDSDKDSINSVSANYTILDTDGYALIDVTTSSTNRTITLPTVAANKGRIIKIRKADTGTGTTIIDPEGSETIEGSSSSLVLTEDREYLVVRSTGSEWILDEVSLFKTKWQDMTLVATNHTFLTDDGRAYRDLDDQWYVDIRIDANISPQASSFNIAMTGGITSSEDQAMTGWANKTGVGDISVTSRVFTNDTYQWNTAHIGNSQTAGEIHIYGTRLKVSGKPSWATSRDYSRIF